MDALPVALLAGVVSGAVVAFGLWVDQRRPDARTVVAVLTFFLWGLPAALVVGALLITDRRPEWRWPVDTAAVLVSAAWVAWFTYRTLGP